MPTDPGARRAAALGAISLFIGLLGPFAIRSGRGALRRSRAAGRGISLPALFGIVTGIISTSLLVVGVISFALAVR